MKFSKMLGRLSILVLVAGTVFAADREKDKAHDGDVVDSGSFGVFVNAKRMATETFSIHQSKNGNSVTSGQFKQEGQADASQRFEMQVTAGGGLVSYEWKELAPGKSELALLPNNEFLIEKVTENPGEKPKEKPFLMPNTSVILDNNFFVQREVLVWRYLASSCPIDNGRMKCAPATFGAIIPQERDSVRVAIAPVAEEKVSVNGSERQLLHLSLKVEDSDWDLWVDPQDHFKLMRVGKTGDNVQIVRD